MVGFETGRGPTGVVLVHQTDRVALCGWWPYAVHLAQDGYSVLMFDLRCYGESPCPTDLRAQGRLPDDVAAATARLRQDGARSVVLVGASIGGSVVLRSAANPPAGVVAAVDLSGSVDESARGAVLKVPFLYAASAHDQYADPDGTRPIVGMDRNKDSRFVVLPSGSGHGWGLLYGNRADGTSPFSAAVETFIATHLAR